MTSTSTTAVRWIGASLIVLLTGVAALLAFIVLYDVVLKDEPEPSRQSDWALIKRGYYPPTVTADPYQFVDNLKLDPIYFFGLSRDPRELVAKEQQGSVRRLSGIPRHGRRG